MTDQIAPEIESRLQTLDIYRCYKRSKYLSVKHSSYFHVYEELLTKYRGKNFTFVEIGVLNGGSLFMWRDFFGPGARIIGIDLNPDAKKWEKDNFEIFVGSQSDENFWDQLFLSVGDVDVVLDDGGHTNEQQIITAEKCFPHIKDGGMLIVEDTHTSYMTKFGNPSKYSFISFRVDRTKCFACSLTSNEGISSNARDFRNQGSLLQESEDFLRRRLRFLSVDGIVRRSGAYVARLMFSVRAKLRSRKLRKYFR
jgi:hypothetical protein